MKNARPRWLNRDWCTPGPYLTLVLSQEELDRELRRLGIKEHVPFVSNDHCNATVHMLRNSKGRRCCLVSLKAWEKRSGIEIAGLLVHEAVHIWQDYAENIGEHNPGSEQEAYAIQAIAQELMWEFQRRCVR
jgi:hypothetical protein